MTSTRLATRICSLVMAGLLVTTQALAQAAPVLPNPGNAPISREKQIQLGFQAAAEVYKQMPVLPDNSAETQYVRQIGQRLVATIPQQYSWPFEFHTIAAKDVNAFALPGGPMFVNVGTILAAKNEAELAGVMSHEMAHVYMQHSAKQMQKNAVPSIIAGLGQVLGSMIGGVGGALASVGAQVGGGMLSMKYSRADEAQADAVGAIIMYKAGYDPRALAAFFETISAEGSQGPQFLSDHPNPGNREQAILNEVQDWPPKQYRTDTAAFNRVRTEAKSVTLYTAQQIAEGAKTGKWVKVNQQNGAVFKAPPGVNVQQTSSEAGSEQQQASGPVAWNQVAPSSRMVTSDIGPIGIARPQNWEIVAPQQQGQSYTIAPRAGLVGNGLGYGVVVNQVTPQYGVNAGISQITSQIVQQMQSGGGDLQPVGSQQSITVNGVRGRSQMMQSTSPFPTAEGNSQRETDWLVTFPMQDGSVVYLVFVSTQADFNRLKPTFNNMLRSIRFQ
jgi:Zn-dependent protease with chaperone function